MKTVCLKLFKIIINLVPFKIVKLGYNEHHQNYFVTTEFDCISTLTNGT
jgi:hypothetical protein